MGGLAIHPCYQMTSERSHLAAKQEIVWVLVDLRPQVAVKCHPAAHIALQSYLIAHFLLVSVCRSRRIPNARQ